MGHWLRELLAEYLLHVPVVHFVILDSLGQLERTADPDGRGGEVVVHHRRLLREHVEGLALLEAAPLSHDAVEPFSRSASEGVKLSYYENTSSMCELTSEATQ